MFIEEVELFNVMHQYQLLEITEGDDDIMLESIAAAEEELRSYLEANNQVRFRDGRPILDLNAILSATGTDRNALLVRHCSTIALWYLIERCNVDIIEQQVRERYDRAIKWLQDLGSGVVNLSSLPTLPADDQNNPNNRAPFAMGSNKKFRYE